MYLWALMKEWYGNGTVNDEEMKKLAEIIAEKISDKRIRCIGIYGMGKLGNWLLKLFQHTGIKVVCGIDKNYDKMKRDIPVVGLENIPKELDAIVVSIFYDYTKIAPELRKKTNALILSAGELI